MPATGEQPGEKGRKGVHKAKVWLDRSTRVGYCYTAYDDTPSVDLLTFACPGTGRTASFDIGGHFRGEELENKYFLAEVKNYTSPKSDQYSEFKKFLSLCYIAYKAKPGYCGRLLWITWRPFKCEKWEDLTTVTEVIEAVVDDRQRVFGAGVTEADARNQIDLDAAAAVADRLWLIILSEANETLVITHDHYAEVVKLIAMEARVS